MPPKKNTELEKFSAEEDEKLIELVFKEEILYNASLPSYKDVVARNNVWKEIGEAIKKTGDECKKRWKNLRDSFFRFKRKIKLPTGSAATDKTSKWPLYNSLSFLNNVPMERQTITNVATDNNYDPPLTAQSTEQNGELLLEGTGSNTDSIAALNSSVGNTEISHSNSLLKPGFRRKRKADVHTELIELLKKREEERQIRLKALSETKSTFTDTTLNTFCEHLKSVFSSLPNALMLQAKLEIYNTIIKYEIQAEQIKEQGQPSSPAVSVVSTYCDTPSPHTIINTPSPPEPTDLTAHRGDNQILISDLGHTSKELNTSCDSYIYDLNNFSMHHLP